MSVSSLLGRTNPVYSATHSKEASRSLTGIHLQEGNASSHPCLSLCGREVGYPQDLDGSGAQKDGRFFGNIESLDNKDDDDDD